MMCWADSESATRFRVAKDAERGVHRSLVPGFYLHVIGDATGLDASSARSRHAPRLRSTVPRFFALRGGVLALGSCGIARLIARLLKLA